MSVVLLKVIKAFQNLKCLNRQHAIASPLKLKEKNLILFSNLFGMILPVDASVLITVIVMMSKSRNKSLAADIGLLAKQTPVDER